MARPPKAPTYLDEIATAEWKARAKQLMERGDLIDADWRNLELYCLNYSMYRRAVADLAARGFSVEGSRGATTTNPALKAKSDAEKIMIKMSSLFFFFLLLRRRNPVEVDETDALDRL